MRSPKRHNQFTLKVPPDNLVVSFGGDRNGERNLLRRLKGSRNT